MESDRIDRLLDKAEKAADDGEYEKAWAYDNIADSALAQKRVELDAMQASMTTPAEATPGD